MLYRGQVTKKPFAIGTKSERDAVVLATDSGEYVLRRRGGNPFHDPQLDQLVGRSIACEGTVNGYTLIFSHCEAEPTAPDLA